MKAIYAPVKGKKQIIEFPEQHDWKWFADTIHCDWIEVVHPEKLPEGYAMIVDEEGLLTEKPLNRFGSWLYGIEKHGQPIVGDVLIVKESYTPEGLDHVGMMDGEAEELIKRLICPF